MDKIVEENLDRIFSIQDISDTQVIIQVHAVSPLLVAQYPFVEQKYKYITVTRGEEHILTIIYEDGATYSFHWGDGSSTLVTENLERLKGAVEQFIDENEILLDYAGGTVNEACILYNNSYDKWQLRLDPCNATYWGNSANSIEEMIEECKKFIVAEEWIEDKAITGIDRWTAKNFKVTLK